ncbi:MAG: DNA topoisomerase, partial [Eubacterium sp.]|nr:DNA topoisomerase [Eubacterium sp.]
FLCDVADLVEKRLTTDIIDISNQSSKEGIRIVLELKRGADAEKLKHLLYKKTRLEDTFGVNMLAVAAGRPETLGLRGILEHFVDFQFEITTKRYQTLLARDLEKKEVQEGLIWAVDIIDLIIEILRGSKNQKQVKDCLTMGITDGIRFRRSSSKEEAEKLAFTQRQAQAILDMRLSKLIGLELKALQKEFDETVKRIRSYEEILNDYSVMAGVITDDLEAIAAEFGRPRRTTIEEAEEVLFEEPEEEETELVFLMDRFGYVRTFDLPTYERNKEASDSGNRFVFRCMSTDKICLFTDTGNMHTIRVKNIPLRKFREKGIPADNLCNYSTDTEQVVFAAPLAEVRINELLFVSSRGMVKT